MLFDLIVRYPFFVFGLVLLAGWTLLYAVGWKMFQDDHDDHEPIEPLTLPVCHHTRIVATLDEARELLDAAERDGATWETVESVPAGYVVKWTTKNGKCLCGVGK
jgi:hypothetical protein